MCSQLNCFAEKENYKDAIERNTKGRTVKPVATFYKPTNPKVFWPASGFGLFFFFWLRIGIFLFFPSFFAQYISKTHSVLGTLLPEQVPGETQENIPKKTFPRKHPQQQHSAHRTASVQRARQFMEHRVILMLRNKHMLKNLIAYL